MIWDDFGSFQMISDYPLFSNLKSEIFNLK